VNVISYTHTRDISGRYIIRFPFKNDPALLGDSKSGALNALNKLFKKFTSNPTYKELYSEFVREHQSLGHMVNAVSSDNQTSPAYYMPHLGVLRESSRTTKLRVVFNASSRTSTGYSLNDILHMGSKLQAYIAEIFLWTRTHRILFSTDIVKIAVH